MGVTTSRIMFSVKNLLVITLGILTWIAWWEVGSPQVFMRGRERICNTHSQIMFKMEECVVT